MNRSFSPTTSLFVSFVCFVASTAQAPLVSVAAAEVASELLFEENTGERFTFTEKLQRRLP